ncbi:Arc2 [Carabus blaptoides fortunei]
MDPTHLQYLTEDELTYELKIRGLPDVGTRMEKRNILEGIFASSLNTTFPVRKPSQEDDHIEHTVCQQKLQEMSGTLLALLHSSQPDLVRFNARLGYIKERVMRITSVEMRNRLLVIWAQLLGDFNTKKSQLLNRSGDLLSLNPEISSVELPLETTRCETSFIERLNQLDVSTPPARVTHTHPAHVSFAPPLFSSVNPPTVAAEPNVSAQTPAEPVSAVNKYIQVSRWNLSFDGTGSVNDFIERAEETARARGVSYDLFRQSSDLFKNQALVWHRHVREEISSWQELVSRLRERSTQGPNERTEIFVAIMQSLFSRFSYTPDEAARLQMIIRNLQPRYQTEISVMQSRTIKQLLDVCKHMEDAAHRASKFKNPPLRSATLSEPELAPRQERQPPDETRTIKVDRQEQTDWMNTIATFCRTREICPVRHTLTDDDRPFMKAFALLKAARASLKPVDNIDVYTADGSSQAVLGSVLLPITLDGVTKSVNVLVVASLRHPLVLGMDFCREFRLRLNFDTNTWRSKDKEIMAMNTIRGLPDLTAVQSRQLQPVIRAYEDSGSRVHKKISPITYRLRDLEGKDLGVWHVKDLKPERNDETDEAQQ